MKSYNLHLIRYFFLLSSLFCLGFSYKLSAQATNNVWLFGTNAGLDFTTSPPTPITSPLSSLEGTATVSDNNGDLLFYTNGVTIWDRNNTVMPNGNGLLGGSSSTQAALIIPLANYCNKYIVFTTQDHQQNGDIRYSIVDMCLNNGFGDVVATQKNIFLTTGMSEKLTSVLHSNGSDIWVISHKLSSSEFYAWKVSPDGTVSPPVISPVGFNYAWNNMIGPIKASPDGTKLAACTTFNSYSCELLNFNKNSGAITYDRNLMNYGVSGGVYGLEFSPNSQLLYISSLWGTSTLSQFDLTTNTLLQLSSISGNYHHGALQLGIDGRIYHARNLQSFVGVINNPNTVGVGCNYVDNGQVLLPGTQCNAGFPVFNPYSLSGTQTVAANLISDTLVTLCQGGQYTTTVSMDCNATVLWSDGSNTSTLTITQPGTYSVILSNPCGQLFDTVVVQLDNNSAGMTLPADMNFCTFPAGGVTITPTIQGTPNGTETYNWNDGSQNPTFQANAPGTYWLEYTNSCGVIIDSIVIISGVSPSITLPPAITVCQDDYPYSLNPILTDYDSFSWSDGVLTLQRQIGAPGTYTLSAENDCGTATATTVITTGIPPTVSLTPTIDTCINIGDAVSLTASGSNVNTYVWSSGSNGPTTSVINSGTYWVSGQNACGTDTATITLTINYFPQLNIPAVLDTCFTDEGFYYTAQGSDGSYSWSSGSNTATEWFNQEGIYTCTLTNICGSVSSSIEINKLANIQISIPSDSMLFCVDALDQNTLGIEANYPYQLLNDQNQVIDGNIIETGWYTVLASNACGQLKDSIYIDLMEEMYLYLPNTFTPNKDETNELFDDAGYNYLIERIEIFNRWGEVIYSETGDFSGWDGNYHGLPSPDGIYQVQVIYNDCAGRRERFNGHVLLLR